MPRTSKVAKRQVARKQKSLRAHRASAEQTSCDSDSDDRYECPLETCSVTLSRRADVTRHLLTHSNGGRLHECSWPGCNKSFTQRPNLVNHLRIHTGEKLTCLELNCAFKCSDISRMHRHRMFQHGYMPKGRSVSAKKPKGKGKSQKSSSRGKSPASEEHDVLCAVKDPGGALNNPFSYEPLPDRVHRHRAHNATEHAPHSGESVSEEQDDTAAMIVPSPTSSPVLGHSRSSSTSTPFSEPVEGYVKIPQSTPKYHVGYSSVRQTPMDPINTNPIYAPSPILVHPRPILYRGLPSFYQQSLLQYRGPISSPPALALDYPEASHNHLGNRYRTQTPVTGGAHAQYRRDYTPSLTGSSSVPSSPAPPTPGGDVSAIVYRSCDPRSDHGVVGRLPSLTRMIPTPPPLDNTSQYPMQSQYPRHRLPPLRELKIPGSYRYSPYPQANRYNGSSLQHTSRPELPPLRLPIFDRTTPSESFSRLSSQRGSTGPASVSAARFERPHAELTPQRHLSMTSLRRVFDWYSA